VRRATFEKSATDANTADSPFRSASGCSTVSSFAITSTFSKKAAPAAGARHLAERSPYVARRAPPQRRGRDIGRGGVERPLLVVLESFPRPRGTVYALVMLIARLKTSASGSNAASARKATSASSFAEVTTFESRGQHARRRRRALDTMRFR